MLAQGAHRHAACCAAAALRHACIGTPSRHQEAQRAGHTDAAAFLQEMLQQEQQARAQRWSQQRRQQQTQTQTQTLVQR
jgi:hypothetical protein